MLSRLKTIRRRSDGAAAIEFALVFPVLIALLFAEAEFCNYLLQQRRAHQAVTLAAEYLSRDADSMMTTGERHVAEDIWMIVNPTSYLAVEARNGQWANSYSRAFASVKFERTGACNGVNCQFTPKTLWSFHYQDIVADPIYLHCEIKVVANGAPLDGHGIPEGVVGRNAVAVVDFTYPYKPLLSGFGLGGREMHVNAIRATRSGLPLDHESDDWVTRCP
jgi:hypothetical protein